MGLQLQCFAHVRNHLQRLVAKMGSFGHLEEDTSLFWTSYWHLWHQDTQTTETASGHATGHCLNGYKMVSGIQGYPSFWSFHVTEVVSLLKEISPD